MTNILTIEYLTAVPELRQSNITLLRDILELATKQFTIDNDLVAVPLSLPPSCTCSMSWTDLVFGSEFIDQYLRLSQFY